MHEVKHCKCCILAIVIVCLHIVGALGDKLWSQGGGNIQSKKDLRHKFTRKKRNIFWDYKVMHL